MDRLYSLIAGKQRNGKTWRLSAYANEKRLTRRQSIGLVLDELERDLQQHLAEHAKTRLFIHAGVVAVGGIAIVIPGRSYTGKSTLVREFVRAGAAYYSDEYAVLDSRGQVHPYARQLALREGANGTMIRVTAESLGGQIGKRPLPLGLVLVAPFRDGAKWRPRRLSTGQAAMALVRNTVAARQRPSDMLDILQKALAQAVAWQGARGEAAQVVEAVLGILSYSP